VTRVRPSASFALQYNTKVDKLVVKDIGPEYIKSIEDPIPTLQPVTTKVRGSFLAFEYLRVRNARRLAECVFYSG